MSDSRRRGEGGWKEAWAIDFWKVFLRLDWPVSDSAERIPQFHAAIPEGTDHALILYAESRINSRVPHRAYRPATTLDQVPDGEDLLRAGKATLSLGGTKGWMSERTLQVRPDDLTDGCRDTPRSPWLGLDELFWDALAGRQVGAEITFKTPSAVHALTVHEDPAFPDSWPSEELVQVGDHRLQRWDTGARGDFLTGPTNTYPLDLKAITRLRYVPWNGYESNFRTTQIEVG